MIIGGSTCRCYRYIDFRAESCASCLDNRITRCSSSLAAFWLHNYLLWNNAILYEGQKKSVTAAHLEQLEDSDKDAREGSKIISQQEYVTRLRELNDEIAFAWMNNERVAALRLTIKVIF